MKKRIVKTPIKKGAISRSKIRKAILKILEREEVRK